MAKNFRRSNRVPKAKIDEDFVYDEVNFEAIFNNNKKNSESGKELIRQRRKTVSTSSDAHSETSEVIVNGSVVQRCSSWSVLLENNYCDTGNAFNSVNKLAFGCELEFRSRSQSLSLVPFSSDVNISSGQAGQEDEGARKLSSTRGDFLDSSGEFLDLSGNFLSVSQISFGSEIMGDKEKSNNDNYALPKPKSVT